MGQVKNKKICYILIAIMTFFTTGDLILGANSKITLALICSTLSGLAVFIMAFKSKSLEVEKKVDKSINFIKSNCNWSSILLSILDIICSTIAVFTSISFICLIFRSIFIGRLFIKIYKYRTVIRTIIIASFIYLVKRREEMSNLKLSKAQIISAIIFGLGFIYGVLSVIFPQIAIFDDTIAQIASISGCEGIVAYIGIFMKGKQLSAEETETLKLKLEEKAKIKAEKLQAEEDAKALKLLEAKEKAEAEAKAKAEEEARLLARAEELKKAQPTEVK